MVQNVLLYVQLKAHQVPILHFGAVAEISNPNFKDKLSWQLA